MKNIEQNYQQTNVDITTIAHTKEERDMIKPVYSTISNNNSNPINIYGYKISYKLGSIIKTIVYKQFF